MTRKIEGEIWEVYHREREVKHEWIVPDFFSFNFVSTCSPNFLCFGGDWKFEKVVSVSRFHLNLTREQKAAAPVHFTVAIKAGNGEDVTLFPNQRIPEDDTVWRSSNILSWINWKKLGLEPRTTSAVTFTCTMFRDKQSRSGDKSVVSRETQTENEPDTDGRTDQHVHLDLEDLSVLREHFKDLLLSGDDHDVIITVHDKEFKAHKCVLRARSPVFEAMFRNDMKESADGTVSIDDCDPEVFGLFLRYVYTEKVDLQSAIHAVGLYYAGDKYDLPRLKQRCIAFLKISLSPTAISDVVTLAARHGEEELLQQAIVYFSKHLEEIILTVEWQRFLASNPVQANEMYLKAVQCLKAFYTRNE